MATQSVATQLLGISAAIEGLSEIMEELVESAEGRKAYLVAMVLTTIGSQIDGIAVNVDKLERGV